jgi:hypothetical protein
MPDYSKPYWNHSIDELIEIRIVCGTYRSGTRLTCLFTLKDWYILREDFMSKYHDRTLALLGREIAFGGHSALELIEWAKAHDITLPAAYLEWAQLDRKNILHKYSNDDWFGFHEPEIVTTSEGIRGLLFNRENQGNFDKIVQLDKGDDPPVLFAWTGAEPWMVCAKRFSDCIFAQIFDWQYWLEFDSNDPDYKEIGYCGEIELQTDRCLTFLREHFSELVTTQYTIEGKHFIEYRFWRSLKERITVITCKEETTHIRITGEESLVMTLEEELLEAFADDVVPPTFNSVLWAIDFLSARIDRAQQTMIRHACKIKPDQNIIAQLTAAHREVSLRERAGNITFPDKESEFTLGGNDWGIVIRFKQVSPYEWRIEELRLP